MCHNKKTGPTVSVDLVDLMKSTAFQFPALVDVAGKTSMNMHAFTQTFPSLRQIFYMLISCPRQEKFAR